MLCYSIPLYTIPFIVNVLVEWKVILLRGLVTVQSWAMAVVARNGNKNKLSLFHKINVPKNNLLRATWMIKMDDKSLLQK